MAIEGKNLLTSEQNLGFHTFIIKNPTVFQSKYPSFSLIHFVEVMADLKANEVTL